MANFCGTLDEALDHAPQLNPDTDTELKAAKATRIWNQCSAEVKGACLRAGLSATPTEWTSTGSAYLMMEQAEALLTSGRCLLARSTITPQLRDIARDLLMEAWSIIGNPSPPRWASTGAGVPIEGRITWESTVMLATGGAAGAAGVDSRIRSAWTEDRDPGIGTTAGVDRPYAAEEAWQDGSDL